MRYNEVAQAYNTQRLRFPTVLFANMMGFGEKAYFAGAGRLGEGAHGGLRELARAPAASPAQ